MKIPFWLRSRKHEDLDEEIKSHLQMAVRDRMERGEKAPSAEESARRELGNEGVIKDVTHDQWGYRWLENMMQDLQFGARLLRKNPGFSTVAIVTLALGIGANTAIFSVINAVLLSPLPYANPENLVTELRNDSLLNVIDTEAQTQTFSQGGAVNVESMDYTGGTEPVQVHAGLVDAGLLNVLGVPPMLGRIISPEEDHQGGPRVVMASHRFWQNYLGSDPQAIGKSITLSGNSYTVIGVMPASFALPESNVDVLVSLWVGYPEAAAARGVHFMRSYWRLKPGVTIAQAAADMQRIDRRLGEQYPSEERDRHTEFVPLHEFLTGDVRPALLMIFGAVLLVLLIACANFASLLMARAIARHRELVIRGTLGAGRGRLLRQALAESALLAVLSGVLGILLAKWGTSLLLALKPEDLARLNGISMDTRVLAFALGVSILTGIFFGLAPAWSATRADVSEALKEGGRGATASSAGQTLRKVLVVCQLALALVLLVGAGLLMKGFSRLRAVSPGFNPENILTMSIQLPASRYAAVEEQTQFRRNVLERMNSLPGVRAAMVSEVPLAGNWLSHNFVIEGRAPLAVGEEPSIESLSVMGDYFHVMEIPLRSGRDFTPMDREGQPLVAIVNEAAVKEFFPHENPIGARFRWAREEGPPKWVTIIGIAANVKQRALSRPAEPAAYTPYAQFSAPWKRWMAFVVRSPVQTAGLVEAIKGQVWSVDSKIPVNDIQTMDQILAVSLAQERFNSLLLGMFAALALVLTAIGIYGMMSYSVNQRVHEIGIRMALGAQRRDVFRLIVGQGARLALIGVVGGIAGAFALTHFISNLLFGVSPGDPATFVAVIVLVVAVVVLASYMPARRAMHVDPMIALRYE